MVGTTCARYFLLKKVATIKKWLSYLKCHAGQSSIKRVLLICDMSTSTFLLLAVRFQSVSASVFDCRSLKSVATEYKPATEKRRRMSIFVDHQETYNFEALFLIICVFLIDFEVKLKPTEEIKELFPASFALINPFCCP